jgi:hypothetical protein
MDKIVFMDEIYQMCNWSYEWILTKHLVVDEICHKHEIDQMKTFDHIDEIYSTNELSYMYIIIFVDGVINMHAITNM